MKSIYYKLIHNSLEYDRLQETGGIVHYMIIYERFPCIIRGIIPCEKNRMSHLCLDKKNQ